jgi:hypothetical protein
MAKASSKTAIDELPPLSALELHRIARPKEAERLSGRHWDTLERNHPDLILKMGRRAKGMRVGHALQLNKR